MNMRKRFEKEIELIENDEHMTSVEKQKEIRELEREYEAAARESAQEAYDNEYENW